MQLKIGNVTLPNNMILAPMAGVTDLPFRVLCAEQGAGMVCMEMISAKALSYHNKNTEELLHISEKEGLVSLQLFGSEPELMGEMAKQIEELPFAVLDINMGCPVPKIVNNGEGSALMKNPLLAGKIIEAVARSTVKPVTVKIRRGFDDAHENAAELARIAQESGAAAVTVHGRTREQYYAGEADLTCIRAVKQALRIPVIGNGDVTDAASAKRMMEETGCDGVMVGRAARGNPWIFTQIAQGLANERVEKPDRDEVKHMMLRHAGMLLEEKGEYIGVREMRKHVAWYTAGYPNSAAMRRAVNEVTSYAALEKLLDTIW
ncbi:MAG: tRNA dihydrouridine synthase DusB [Lachnospiraceae bacterium]|nr:tRNA dihydrouridine synthase DusB [Lachnospiraceae bacterium]